MGVFEIVTKWPWTSAVLAFVTYVVLLYTYRLTLHPLARFPGPRIAAVTLWYEFYHDFFGRGGQYIWVILDMHGKYGPIVRVSPDELHVNDPSFFPELMPAGKHRRDKYPRAMQVFGFAEAGGATVGHDLHRLRRGAMSKMFSKESVRKLEPIMKQNLDRLLARLKGFKESGNPINLLPMFGAFTNDLISEYAYGFNSNWLAASEFNERFFQMVSERASWRVIYVYGIETSGRLMVSTILARWRVGALALQFAWFMPLMDMIPQRLLLKLNPGMLTFVEFKKVSPKEHVPQSHRNRWGISIGLRKPGNMGKTRKRSSTRYSTAKCPTLKRDAAVCWKRPKIFQSRARRPHLGR